jgi:hypothetical protein
LHPHYLFLGRIRCLHHFHVERREVLNKARSSQEMFDWDDNVMAAT